MASEKKWFQDRYFIIFVGMMVMIVATIMSNPFLLTSQNEKIIERIDDLAAEREQEGQIQTKTILDNMSEIIIANQKKIIDGQQQVLDNITQILFNVTNTTKVVENQTELLEEILIQHTNNTEDFLQTGNISSFSKSLIMPQE